MKTSARFRKILKSYFIFFQPFSVRLTRTNFFFQLIIADDAALLQIYHKHFPWLQATFRYHLGGIDIQHAHFRSHDYHVIIGHYKTRRAKTITIKRSANNFSIGEGDRCRTIPRLHQVCVIFIEVTLLLAHAFVAIPRFWYQHHHHVRK